MDVDGGQKARQVVDGAGEEIKLALEQPVRDAVQPQRQHTRIKQHFPARARRRVAGLYRIEIADQSGEHWHHAQLRRERDRPLLRRFPAPPDQSVAWTVAAAFITAPTRAPAWMISARSEEHTSELQSLMRISYAAFCLKKKKHI